MKTLNIYTRVVLLITAALFGAGAMALGPTIDSLTVQGYMKKNDGLAVTDGTYNFAYFVVQNNVVIWGKEYATDVTAGLFSKTLSGAGQDLTAGAAWANCTGEADFSGATLGSTLLAGAATGALVVRVCSRDIVDGGVRPEFDVTVAAAPTSLVADVAYNVVNGSLVVAAFAAGETLNASAGVGSAGKIVVLDAAGLIDTTMLPVVPVAKGGTGSATAGAALTALGAAASGANSDITSLTAVTTITGLTTPLSADQGGTGKNLTVVNGGVMYTDADSMEVSAAGTAGQVLVSNGAAAPTWASAGSVAYNPGNQRLYSLWTQSNAAAAAAVTSFGYATAMVPVSFAAGSFATGDSMGTFPGMIIRMPNTAALSTCGVHALAASAATSSVRPQWNPSFDAIIGTTTTAADTTNLRLFAGFGRIADTPIPTAACGTSLPCANLPSANGHAFVGFRYVNGTDTTWQCVTCAVGACTVTDSLVPVSAPGTATDYQLSFQMTGVTSVAFKIDGNTVCGAHTFANMPALTDPLTGMVTANKTDGAVAIRGFKFSRISVRSN